MSDGGVLIGAQMVKISHLCGLHLQLMTFPLDMCPKYSITFIYTSAVSRSHGWPTGLVRQEVISQPIYYIILFEGFCCVPLLCGQWYWSHNYFNWICISSPLCSAPVSFLSLVGSRLCLSVCYRGYLAENHFHCCS